MKNITGIILVLFISACATRTLYEPHGYSGGYSSAQVQSDIYVARFAGNASTLKNDAVIFSQFRAIEICRDKGDRVARILLLDDKSINKTVQKASTRNNKTPTTNIDIRVSNKNSYSNTPDLSAFIPRQPQGGTSLTDVVDAYYRNKTYHYPIVDAYFTCHDKVYLAEGIRVKILNAEEVKPYTKDMLGALQVVSIGNSSPKHGGFNVGDIILKVSNQRVLDPLQMVKVINNTDDKTKISSLVVRDGEKKEIYFPAKDYTQDIEQENAQIINSACSVNEIKPRPICNMSRSASD